MLWNILWVVIIVKGVKQETEAILITLTPMEIRADVSSARAVRIRLLCRWFDQRMTITTDLVGDCDGRNDGVSNALRE